MIKNIPNHMINTNRVIGDRIQLNINRLRIQINKSNQDSSRCLIVDNATIDKILTETSKLLNGELFQSVSFKHPSDIIDKLWSGNVEALEAISMNPTFPHIIAQYMSLGINLLANYPAEIVISNVITPIMSLTEDYPDISDNSCILNVILNDTSNTYIASVEFTEEIFTLYGISCLKIKNNILNDLNNMKKISTMSVSEITRGDVVKENDIYISNQYYDLKIDFIEAYNKNIYSGIKFIQYKNMNIKILVDMHRGKFDLSRFQVIEPYEFGTIMKDSSGNFVLYYSSIADLIDLFELKSPPLVTCAYTNAGVPRKLFDCMFYY